LAPSISTNTSTQQGNSYFFDTADSNCYISSVDYTDAQKLIAHIRYAHIGRDALEMSNRHIKLGLDQTKTELEQIKTSLGYRITKPLRYITGFK
jgi:hypothetical protein